MQKILLIAFLLLIPFIALSQNIEIQQPDLTNYFQQQTLTCSSNIISQIPEGNSQENIEKLKKNLNRRINQIKVGLMFSGAAFVAGAAINIQIENIDSPDTLGFNNNSTSYYNSIVAHQRSVSRLKKHSSYAFIIGGVGMLFTGFNISLLKVESNKSALLIKSSDNRFSVCYRF